MDDELRELTWEEAEEACRNAVPVPMSDAEIERILRYVMVMDGRIPIERLHQSEVDQVFAYKLAYPGE